MIFTSEFFALRSRSKMLRTGTIALLAAGLLGSAGLADARAAKKPKKAKPPVELELSSNPILLMDVQTGEVILHKDANKKWYPASLTKLMTAYVAFRALQVGEITQDTTLEISPHALSYPPSKMGFKVGTRLTVQNALKMVVVKSANDISAALGERVAGSEAAFVQRMNKEAKRLGMSATRFVNANGLYAAGQTSSARDMALLARQILIEFPQHRPLFQIPAIRHGKRVLRSYNKLLERFSGTDGMKTGFVCASGYNIVASASRGGRQYVAVVLGAPTTQIRAETAAYLLTKGFATKGAGLGPSILDGAAFGPVVAPFDMRPQICPKGRPRWVGQKNYKTSYLGKRFKLMEPVRVYAGIAKKNQRVVLPAQLAVLSQPAPRPKIRLVAKKMGQSQLTALPMPKPKR